MLQNRYMPRTLPEPLQGLVELAVDMRWSWNHESDTLWRRMDPRTWDATGNPWFILESIGRDRLAELAADRDFLQEIERHLSRRQAALSQRTWFGETYGSGVLEGVAYFSMEFGLSEALPLYSGGLGILAGDYLKTASDLGLPLCGVGLLYQQGYFRQVIDAAGNQIEFYPYNDPAILPVTPLRDAAGNWIRIDVELPGRTLSLRTWEVVVGRVRLYLLDSNDPINTPQDRGITEKLYGGGSEIRLQQEIILGVGGWRLLETLGAGCEICHLNEGHAAFAILERAASFMRDNDVPFEVALHCTRAGNVFTTHTPVDAAFDRYPASMLLHYGRPFAEGIGMSHDELLALGRLDPDNRDEPFNMAWLALRGSGMVNGVSSLHGRVSRSIFQPLFPRWPRAEVPVTHVTNGVHMPSWDSADSDDLWTRTCGKERWLGGLETMEKELATLSDEELWAFRSRNRRSLVEFVRKRLGRQQAIMGLEEKGIKPLDASVLDPDALTIGFARRFTSYKRPNLLLHDPDRLAAILSDKVRPVQLILAGKAHPRDQEGREMIRQWVLFSQRPDVRGQVVFIQDYDMEIAANLVQGMDLWINTPRRPWEASGTSGMKVLVNGGLNLSELDGWWAEAWCAEAGWALGDRQEHDNDPVWDAAEARQLYELLEEEVIPAFYTRDEHGTPHQWVARMWASMARLTPRFSSNRMVREYTESIYLPQVGRYRQLIRDRGALGRELENWRQELARHWQHLRFGEIKAEMREDGIAFSVPVYLDDLDPGMVRVELYAEPARLAGEPERITLQRSRQLAGSANAYLYRARVATTRPATDYTPRIIPHHPRAMVPLEDGHILWAS